MLECGDQSDVCTREPGRTVELQCHQNDPGHAPRTDTGRQYTNSPPSQRSLQATGGTEGSPLGPSLNLFSGGRQSLVKRSPEPEPGAGGGGVVTFSVTASLDTLRQKLLWSLQNNNRNVTQCWRGSARGNNSHFAGRQTKPRNDGEMIAL